MHLLGEGYAPFEENELQTWWDLDSKVTLTFPKHPGMIIEKRMWRMTFSTKEHVYFLRKGEKMEGGTKRG